MIRKDGWGAVNSMSKEDEYRGFAATCLDLAKSNNKPDEKLRLLAMADAWLYRRGDLFEKRRRLMSDWAAFCAKAKQAGGNVVSVLAAG